MVSISELEFFISTHKPYLVFSEMNQPHINPEQFRNDLL